MLRGGMIFLVAICWASFALAEETPAGDELFEKAMFLEETSGDLAAAEKLYVEIAEKQAEKAELGGRALVRLANIYLRDNRRAQAAETLKRILARYGDHEKLANHAKEQLSKLTDVLGGQPVVLFTQPKNLADAVSSDVKAIEVTFDRPMADGSWSWTGGPEHFPKESGKPSYDKFHMTCTLPVKLEPGRAYWVGVNSPSYQNFKSDVGTPAAQYVLLFATSDSSGKPTEIPAELLAEAKRMVSTDKSTRKSNPSAKRDARKLAAHGWQLWGQRKLSEAEDQFRKALEKDDSDANTWNGLGWALMNQGVTDEAEQAFKQGVALDPKQAACLNGLGWIAKGQDRTDEALDYWKQAVAAAPEATAALNGIVSTCLEQEDYEQALEWLEKWKKVEPNNAEVQSQIEKAKDKLQAAKQ